MPLFYGTVNQLLINLFPFIRDALLEFVNTGNLASINPVLHDPPDLVIHRMQICAIRGGHKSEGIKSVVSRLSKLTVSKSKLTVSRALCAGAPSC